MTIKEALKGSRLTFADVYTFDKQTGDLILLFFISSYSTSIYDNIECTNFYASDIHYDVLSVEVEYDSVKHLLNNN